MITIDEKTKQIAAKLRSIRELKGLTREAFCEPLNENPDYWGLIERGEQAISLPKLLSVCHYYKIPIEEVIQIVQTQEDNTQIKNEVFTLLESFNTRQLELAKKLLEAVELIY